MEDSNLIVEIDGLRKELASANKLRDQERISHMRDLGADAERQLQDAQTIYSLRGKLAERDAGLEAARRALERLRNCEAVQGRLVGDDKELVGLAYGGSSWAVCYDPSYEPWELVDSIAIWLKNECDAALAAPAIQAMREEWKRLRNDLEQRTVRALAAAESAEKAEAELAEIDAALIPANPIVSRANRIRAIRLAHETALEKFSELSDELGCVTADRDSWAAQSRQHNIDRMAALDALAEARKDTEYMDWWQANVYVTHGLHCETGETVLYKVGHEWVRIGQGENLRAAIAAARGAKDAGR